MHRPPERNCGCRSSSCSRMEQRQDYFVPLVLPLPLVPLPLVLLLVSELLVPLEEPELEGRVVELLGELDDELELDGDDEELLGELDEEPELLGELVEPDVEPEDPVPEVLEPDVPDPELLVSVLEEPDELP
jgi:hypothetical protein